MRKSIDGRTRRRSVDVMAFSSSLREILEEIFAVIVCCASPDTCAPANAGLLFPSQDNTLPVLPNAPQPDNMLRLSSRLVFPEPLRPRIKLMPGSQVILSSGLREKREKFLKLRITLKSIRKARTAILCRNCPLRTREALRYSAELRTPEELPAVPV